MSQLVFHFFSLKAYKVVFCELIHNNFDNDLNQYKSKFVYFFLGQALGNGHFYVPANNRLATRTHFCAALT
jgi:hypothetical protein